MNRDFKNYDYLTISVKTAQLDRILECYLSLGWREVKREDDREYCDMKYIALRRPHKVPDKDRLQLLQVRMENNVNAVSAINARKHAKSGAFFAVLLSLALGLLALGLWLFLGLKGETSSLFGAVSCCLSGALIVAATIVVAAARKPEEASAAKKIAERLKLIESLVLEARALSPSADDCNLCDEEGEVQSVGEESGAENGCPVSDALGESAAAQVGEYGGQKVALKVGEGGD